MASLLFIGNRVGTIPGGEAQGKHVLAVVAVVSATEEGTVDQVDKIQATFDAWL